MNDPIVAYILNHLNCEVEIPVEIAPGFLFRKATPMEQKFIVDYEDATRPEPHFIYPQRYIIDQSENGNSGARLIQNPAEWNYYVIQFDYSEYGGGLKQDVTRLKILELSCLLSESGLRWHVLSNVEPEWHSLLSSHSTKGFIFRKAAELHFKKTANIFTQSDVHEIRTIFDRLTNLDRNSLIYNACHRFNNCYLIPSAI